MKFWLMGIGVLGSFVIVSGCASTSPSSVVTSGQVHTGGANFCVETGCYTTGSTVSWNLSSSGVQDVSLTTDRQGTTSSVDQNIPSQTGLATEWVTIAGHTFLLEIASTPDQKEIGLMGRARVSPTGGMIFPFEEDSKVAFWMKDTLISLDMVRVDSGWSIVDIQTAVPCTTEYCPTYVPVAAARSVIELQAGITKTDGIKKGDKVNQ